jgi:hypoxia up-regulated 1
MSLVNSAILADFSVLGLINENSAAAIHFAISRNDTDPIYVVLFNYGSHNLQISVVKAFGFYDETKNKTI